MVKMTKSCLAVFSHTHTNVVKFANSKLQLLSVYAKNDDSGVRKLSTCTRFTSWKAYTCVGLHILKPRVPGCALSTSLVGLCVTEWRQEKSAVCGIARWLSKLTLGIGQSVEHFGLQLNQVGPSAAELRLNTISSFSPFRDLDSWRLTFQGQQEAAIILQSAPHTIKIELCVIPPPICAHLRPNFYTVP